MQYDESMFWKISNILSEVKSNMVKIRCGFVKFLNILKELDKKAQIKVDGYFYNKVFHCYGWLIPFDLFIEGFMVFQQYQLKAITQWNNENDWNKLFEILRLIFHKNYLAHNQRFYSRKQHYFSKKSLFLDKAIQYADKLSKILPFFDYGMQYDNSIINYPIIIYFQFDMGNNQTQISFHANDYEDIKQFTGKWNEIRNDQFPLKKKEILKILKEKKIDLTTLSSSKELELDSLSKEQLITYLNSKETKLPTNFQNPSIQIPIQIKEPIKNEIIPKKSNNKLITDYL